MKHVSITSTQSDSRPSLATGRGLTFGIAVTAVLLLGACAADTAVEIENTRAARELAQSAMRSGSVYAGWRVFQERCATCHGPDANGSAAAPDLLPLVQQMGPRRFVGLVLTRYDWNFPPPDIGTEREALEALIDKAVQGKEPVIIMPAWDKNPTVSAHITDLYAYLAARADGSQGNGRPLSR